MHLHIKLGVSNSPKPNGKDERHWVPAESAGPCAASKVRGPAYTPHTADTSPRAHLCTWRWHEACAALHMSRTWHCRQHKGSLWAQHAAYDVGPLFCAPYQPCAQQALGPAHAAGRVWGWTDCTFCMQRRGCMIHVVPVRPSPLCWF